MKTSCYSARFSHAAVCNSVRVAHCLSKHIMYADLRLSFINSNHQQHNVSQRELLSWCSTSTLKFAMLSPKYDLPPTFRCQEMACTMHTPAHDEPPSPQPRVCAMSVDTVRRACSLRRRDAESPHRRLNLTQLSRSLRWRWDVFLQLSPACASSILFPELHYFRSRLTNI